MENFLREVANKRRRLEREEAEDSSRAVANAAQQLALRGAFRGTGLNMGDLAASRAATLRDLSSSTVVELLRRNTEEQALVERLLQQQQQRLPSFASSSALLGRNLMPQLEQSRLLGQVTDLTAHTPSRFSALFSSCSANGLGSASLGPSQTGLARSNALLAPSVHQQLLEQVAQMQQLQRAEEIQARVRRHQELANLANVSSIPPPASSLMANISTPALTSHPDRSALNPSRSASDPSSIKSPAAVATREGTTGTKRKVTLLYMSCDDEDLSQYQTAVRKQIELFEADNEDVSISARGRNRPIVSAQVGIRCKHCKVAPPQQRQRAAIYYPSKLDRLYQMSQTIASLHLAEYCQHIPEDVRSELARLRESKSAALGGKKYWADAGRAMGLVEIDKRLFFATRAGRQK